MSFRYIPFQFQIWLACYCYQLVRILKTAQKGPSKPAISSTRKKKSADSGAPTAPLPKEPEMVYGDDDLGRQPLLSEERTIRGRVVNNRSTLLTTSGNPVPDRVSSNGHQHLMNGRSDQGLTAMDVSDFGGLTSVELIQQPAIPARTTSIQKHHRGANLEDAPPVPLHKSQVQSRSISDLAVEVPPSSPHPSNNTTVVMTSSSGGGGDSTLKSSSSFEAFAQMSKANHHHDSPVHDPKRNGRRNFSRKMNDNRVVVTETTEESFEERVEKDSRPLSVRARHDWVGASPFQACFLSFNLNATLARVVKILHFKKYLLIASSG